MKFTASLIKRIKDPYALKARVEKALSGSYIKVGLLGKKNSHPGKLTNAQLGVIHEFGAPEAGIPSRSFLRANLNAKRDIYITYLGNYARAALDNKGGVRNMLGLLGQRVSADTKLHITAGAGIPPPNSAATIKRKGSSRPLVDTGRLVASITYEVVKAGDK